LPPCSRFHTAYLFAADRRDMTERTSWMSMLLA
jgi:hypothetical protein